MDEQRLRPGASQRCRDFLSNERGLPDSRKKDLPPPLQDKRHDPIEIFRKNARRVAQRIYLYPNNFPRRSPPGR